jgi:predicted TIM-barrel fold metal-dependent hydrolase
LIVDTNVHLSRWPFRRLPGDETSDLVARLRARNVRQAWAGSFDGIFQKDLAAVNERLVVECRTHGPNFLTPFGSINPMLPNWEEDVRRCHEVHRMPGLRLHPNYHGYTLAHPALAALLRQSAERSLIVQMAISMEDTRTQGPLIHVPPVDAEPLLALVRQTPGVRLVLLNWPRGVDEQEQAVPLAATGSVYFDISMVEGIEGLARLSKRVPISRILFGSHYPLFAFESAALKVQESGLGEAEKQALVEGNAGRLLAGKAA